MAKLQRFRFVIDLNFISFISQRQKNDTLKIVYTPQHPFCWGKLTWIFLERCESRGQFKGFSIFLGWRVECISPSFLFFCSREWLEIESFLKKLGETKFLMVIVGQKGGFLVQILLLDCSKWHETLQASHSFSNKTWLWNY